MDVWEPGSDRRVHWLARGVDLDALVGLDVAAACGLVEAASGFAAVVPPEVVAVTADFMPNRIRLFADTDDKVRRVSAG